ncbi:hypothetical protein BO78DRAFT_341731 [Aspergillus sclerotiicarbonarius CBS 121057]|uniref:MYB DNA-binding domain protein n=1 Tax=Aspergillus sclerotiicarbonarius (strain CBS 121057 / IBT 28362) TaxID=1448318 RepID=A0A319ECA5_ASPSB|nr:hypothetical protein BO78DRAFT_341731 [Aspergillus sclerotiicarbonarius CBS 121057]
MGNLSSHPSDQEHNESPENFDTSRMAMEVPSSSPKSIKKSKRELQPDGSTTSKRKRKALSNATNDQNKAVAAPNSPQSSPHNASTARPAKRKKVTEPKQKQTPSRKAETAKQKPNDAPMRDAAPDPQPVENGGSNGVPRKPIKESSTPEAGTEEGRAASTPGPAQEESKASDGASENPTGQGEFKKGKRGEDASKGKEGKLVGFFTAEEVKKLEKFKLKLCTTHGISNDTFDLMVQHSERDKSTPFPCHADVITKPTFWKEVYQIIPNRDKRSVYRFMRRHFQCSAQKPHHWTHEQDDELILLHNRHGPKWAYIAKMIGRSDDDVVQRWKNRLEHRRTMNRGPWSEVEVRALQEHLQFSWTAMKEIGHDVGRDIYEMDESLIAWGQVSNKMNNCRSRQQCADKWRKVRRKVLAQRTKGNPDAFYDPVVETKPPKRRSKSRSIAAPQSQSDKQFKSAEFVNSDEDSDEGMTETPSVDQSTAKTSEGSSPEPLKPASSKARSHKASDKSDSDSSESESEDESDSDATSSGAGIKSENRSSSDSGDRPLKPKKKEPLVANGLSQQTKHASNTAANKAKATKVSTSRQQESPAQQKRKRSPVVSSESESESESEDSEDSESRSPPRKRVSKPTLKASPTLKPQEKTRKADTSSDDESDDSSASDSESRLSPKKVPVATGKVEESDDQSRRPSVRQGLAKTHKSQTQIEPPRVKSSGSPDDSDGDSDDASSDDSDSSDSVSNDDKPAKSSKHRQQAASATSARKSEKPSAQPAKKADMKRPKIAKSAPADSSDTSSSDDDKSGQSRNTKTDSGSESETDSSESDESGSDS